ncbi:MAG: hypothetical protein ACRD0A_18380 [Acidimicrobiales bacterium]
MAKRSRKRVRQDERRRAADDRALAELAAAHHLDDELERLLAEPGPVTWRTDCDHYRSRTLPSGDVVPRCRLDLAGPLGCPADCPSFEGRGSLGAGAG